MAALGFLGEHNIFHNGICNCCVHQMPPPPMLCIYIGSISFGMFINTCRITTHLFNCDSGFESESAGQMCSLWFSGIVGRGCCGRYWRWGWVTWIIYFTALVCRRFHSTKHRNTGEQLHRTSTRNIVTTCSSFISVEICIRHGRFQPMDVYIISRVTRVGSN